MNHILEFCLFFALGYLAITSTYPAIMRFPRAWRWTWSVIVLALYSTAHGLFQKFWTRYYGIYGFFEFLAGAVIASAFIQKKKLKNEK